MFSVGFKSHFKCLLTYIAFFEICSLVSSQYVIHDGTRVLILTEVENKFTANDEIIRSINVPQNKHYNVTVYTPHYHYDGHMYGKTSCDKLNCYNTFDYPVLLVNRLFRRFSRNKTVSRPFDPPLEKKSIYDTESFTPIPCETVAELFQEKHDMTEALNRRGKAVLLVSVKNQYVPKGIECLAPQYCKDYDTPENYVYQCKEKTQWEILLTLSRKRDKLNRQNVHLMNGCKYELIPEEKRRGGYKNKF